MRPNTSLRILPIVGGAFKPSPEIIISVNHRESGSSRFAQEVFDFREGDEKEQPLNRLTVEGQGPGGKLIFDRAGLLICSEFSVLCGQFPLGVVELFFGSVSALSGGSMVDRDFDQPPFDEATLDRPRLGSGECPGGCLHPENTHGGLLAGNGDSNIEIVPTCPVEQLVGGIAPLQSEGWFKDGLAIQVPCEDQPAEGKKFAHGRSMARRSRRNKVRRGSVLIEATYALTFLTGLSLVLLKLAINVTAPRQWTLQQSITDAYLTYEKAYAQRLPFSTLLDGSSPWPAYPSKSELTVELGKLPGGKPIDGRVIRTRMPDPDNFPVDGGSGTVETNPAGMKVWKFQSLLVYEIGGREYVKSRTVVRSQ